MSMSRKLKKKLMAAALALSVMGAGTAYAMPTGGEVATGTVTGFSANPASGATIANTTNALINWQTFSIGANEILNFKTAAGTILMNQVTGGQISQLLGTLKDTGTGSLWICNPAGIVVGADAVINPNALTLATIQNLNVNQFNHFAGGGTLTLYPQAEIEVKGHDSWDFEKGIHATHAIEMLATSITIGDHVSLTTANSLQTYRAISGGVFTSENGGTLVASTESSQQPVASTSNTITMGDSMIGDSGSDGSLSLIAGKVTLNQGACIDQNTTGPSTIIAASNINEKEPKKSNAIGSNTVSFGGSHSFLSDGKFGLRVYAGEVVNGDKDYFGPTGGAPISLTGGTEKPTNPDQVYPGKEDPPTPPTPPGPTPGKLTPEQEIALKNALDAQRANDATAKALQDALAGAQNNNGSGEGSDHVTVMSGGDSTGGPNITQGLEGLTVKEASARVRSIAKDYMKALNAGNKAEADRLKEALKEANNNVKILKENEKKAKEEAEKAAQRENAANAAQEALRNAQAEKEAQPEEAASNAQEALLNAQREKEQLEELKELAARAAQEARDAYEKEQQQSQTQQDEEKPSAPPLSELIRQFGTEQQKQALQQQQQQQGGGTVITTVGEQKDAGSKINDLIGTELLEKETNARNKLVKAKTSEEKAEAMKELDEVHKEETEKVNKLLKEQEEKQRIELMEQQLEAQRRQEEQLKVVGGPEGGEALTRGAKRANDALKKTKDLEKRIDELKKQYDETDKAARKLTDQYYKAKEAGASKEELEKIAKEWNELDQKRSELDKQRDNALVEHMNASDEAAKEAAEYSRLQGIAKEAQQELDKLGLDKAKDDLAAKQAEYDRVSGRDIENGRDSAAEAAMKAVDDKYAAELQSLHQQYDEAINNGTSEDIERASSLLENKNMEVGLEKSEAANKAEEEYMTAERKELLQKLQSDKEAITQAEKNLNEAQQKVSNLEKVESAIREKAQDMLTAPDRINDAESAQIKAGVDAQVAALQHKSTEREYGFSSMEAGVTRSILNTSKDEYEAATANVNDLREKANYQPGQSANVFSATRQQTEAALKAGTGK